MRLLPRSHRRTCLLAGAVWLAACAGWWWALPVAPRAEWRLAEFGPIVGIRPSDGALVTVVRTESHAMLADPRVCIHDVSLHGPIRVWEAATGRLSHEFTVDLDRFDRCQLSRTGRWLALGARADGEHAKLELLDLSNGTVAIARLAARGFYSLNFAAGDRWLDYVTTDGIWGRLSAPDVTSVGETRDVSYFAAYSSDGRTMALGGPESDPVQIQILDVETARLIAELQLSTGYHNVSGSVSNDGQVFAAQLASNDAPRQEQWMCWRTSDRAELLRISGTQFGVLGPDGRIAATRKDGQLTIWDVFGRQALRQHYLNSPRWVAPSISPDGRTVAVSATTTLGPGLGFWLEKIGLSCPFPSELDFESISAFDTDSGGGRGVVRGNAESAHWSADGSTLVAIDQDRMTVRVWDIRPRPSLEWFTIGAALLVLPIAFVAQRRVRKLKAA